MLPLESSRTVDLKTSGLHGMAEACAKNSEHQYERESRQQREDKQDKDVHSLTNDLISLLFTLLYGRRAILIYARFIPILPPKL